MEVLTVKTGFEKYPAYKDSGVEWLGEVPEHWEVIKSKFIWKEVISLSDDESERLLSVSQYTGVNINNDRARGETLIGYKKVEKNDLVINIMLAWLGGLGLSSFKGIVSPAYGVYRLSQNFDPKFLHYLYRTNLYLDEFARRSKGVVPSRWRMYTEDFGQVLTLNPPVQEQTAIANFLDRKIELIDQAIAQKEKQIELLKERRQVLINKAVTRGLDPNVPLKDSGVEFLNKIPEHWDIIKFKYVIRTKARLGWKGLKASEYVEESEFGFLSTPNIKNENIDFSNAYFIQSRRYFESPEIMLQEDDVLLVKDGSTLGITNIIRHLPFYCTVNSSIAVLRILYPEKLKASYLLYFLKSDYSQKIIDLKKDGMGVPHLFQSDINNFIVLIPSIQEQDQIVSNIERVNHKILSTISCKKNEIEKLKEYKSTLINSAVTGKIKVN